MFFLALQCTRYTVHGVSFPVSGGAVRGIVYIVYIVYILYILYVVYQYSLSLLGQLLFLRTGAGCLRARAARTEVKGGTRHAMDGYFKS